MTEELQFIPFTSPADRGWAEAMEIYRRSFPYKEQRSEEDHVRALRDPHFRADGIWCGDEFVGILYHWQGDGWHYVEHLAVSLGFVENPHEYIHPSFRRPFEQHRLVLMSYPSPLTDDEARRFADFVRETVLRYTEHEAPQLPRLP